MKKDKRGNAGSDLSEALAYYMSESYPIELRKLSDEEGGGWMASIPFLGRFAFMAIAETETEALAHLEEVKRINFEDYLKQGIPIPDPPVPEEEETYSGRFVIRMPKDLHRRLAAQAAKNGTSQNQYVVSLLSECVAMKDLVDRFATELCGDVKHIIDLAMSTKIELKNDQRVRTVQADYGQDAESSWNSSLSVTEQTTLTPMQTSELRIA